MPFMTAMKYLAARLDNASLDPSTWMVKLSTAYNTLCRQHPAGFVLIDFSTFVAFVLLILYEADLSKWWSERNLRAQGYDDLADEPADGPTSDPLGSTVPHAMPPHTAIAAPGLHICIATPLSPHHHHCTPPADARYQTHAILSS